jgi:hypothetical protein
MTTSLNVEYLRARLNLRDTWGNAVEGKQPSQNNTWSFKTKSGAFSPTFKAVVTNCALRGTMDPEVSDLGADSAGGAPDLNMPQRVPAAT